ncbi:hypothetical protein HII31_01049, partial [Pseudocercospora fuligena]
ARATSNWALQKLISTLATSDFHNLTTHWVDFTTAMVSNDVLDIAADGDVVLICAASEKAEISYRLRVSSAVLNLASPVFKALLSPKFREGNALAANGYVEVPLPDDAAEPMIMMLKALHFDPDIMKHIPESLEILTTSISADKYDCSIAMGHSAFYWISIRSEEFAIDEIHDLLVASNHFRQENLFNKLCKDLIMHSPQLIEASGAAKAAGLEELFANLEEARTLDLKEVRIFLEDALSYEAGYENEMGSTGCARSSFCFYEARRTQALLKKLYQMSIWPSNELESQSLSECIDKLRDIGTDWLKGIEPCSKKCDGMGFIDASGTVAKFQEQADEIEREQGHFCLHCVRQGTAQRIAPENACEHSQDSSGMEE